ncbi:MAG: T9SS type A sorting domain-containing protein [Chitinophagaceae bacterium]
MKIISTLIVFFALNFSGHSQTYLALQDFSTANGITPPAGWSNVSYSDSPNHVWQFADSTPDYLPANLFGDGVAFPYAVISRATYPSFRPNTKLSTPAFSTIGSTNATLEFTEFFRWQSGNTYTIDYSINGGTTWALLEERNQDVYDGWQGGGNCTHTTIPLPADAQNKPAVKVRFSYTIVSASFFWAVDNIKVTNRPPTTRTAASAGGFWSAASTWVGGVVPAFIDNVIIPDNCLVTIDIHPKVQNLTVGGGISGYLKFNNSIYNYLEVEQNLLTNPGSTFQPNYNNSDGREITVKGNITFNGTSDFSNPGTLLTLAGAGTQTIGGTGNLGSLLAPIRQLRMQSGVGVNINRRLTVTEDASIACPVNNGTNLYFDNTAGLSSDSVRLVKINNYNFSSPVQVGPSARYYVRYNENYPATEAAITGNEIPESGIIYSLSIANNSGLTVNRDLQLTSIQALNLYYGIITISPANSITCTNSGYPGSPGFNEAFVQGGDFIVTCTGTSTKTFPVGSDGVPASITFNNLQANGTISMRLLKSSAGAAGTGLTALSATRRWYSRLVTGTYTGYASVSIQLNDNDNFGTTPAANKRVGFQTSLVSAYSSVGQSAINTYQITSAASQTLLGYHALGISAGTMPVIWTGNAGTNDWGDAFNWFNNALPTNNDEVIIDGNRTINLAAGTGNYAAKYLTVRTGSTLNSTLPNTLTVGPAAANNGFWKTYGNFNMSNGTINVKGNAAFTQLNNTSANVQMSGGNMIIDGNNGGNTATSVDPNTPMLEFRSGFSGQFTLNGSGGTITIVDANAATNSKANALEINIQNDPANSYNLNGTTFKFGDGLSADACQAQGFVFQTGNGSSNVRLGNVIVDSRANINGNRFFSASNYYYYPSDIYGNLTVNPGAEVRSFYFPVNPYGVPVSSLAVGGNIINNGVIRILNSDSGRLILGSSGKFGVSDINTPQTISGGGAWSTSLYTLNGNLSSLTVNNKAGVTLSMPLTVVENLALLKGAINTTTTNLLSHGEYYYSTPGTLTLDSGYVSGPLKRLLPAATFSDSTGLFPIGSANFYRPVKLDFTTAPAGPFSLTAQFVATIPASTGLPLNDNGTVIDSITKSGYWDISTTDLVGGVYNASFTGNGFGGIANPAQLRVVKRINAASPWTLQGTHAAGSGVTARRNGLNGFSQFTIASNGVQNSLPVSLLYIRGKKQNAVNTIYWATVTETNNSGFELQRSADGIRFDKVTFIGSLAASGNSQALLTYQFSDAKGFKGTTYYRIQQVDKDGRTTLSNTILIKDQAPVLDISGLFPNPAVNTLMLYASVATNETATLTITDMNGKIILQQNAKLNSGDNLVNLDVSTFPKGAYLIKLTGQNNQSSVKTFVKQ